MGEVHGYGEAYPGKAILESKDFDEKMKRKLLFDNGMAFLGLDPNNYI